MHVKMTKEGNKKISQAFVESYNPTKLLEITQDFNDTEGRQKPPLITRERPISNGVSSMSGSRFSVVFFHVYRKRLL